MFRLIRRRRTVQALYGVMHGAIVAAMMGMPMGTAIAQVAPAAAVAASAPVVRPGPAEVALTFDDLPGIVLKPDQNYLDATNHSLINNLKQRHFPAIGFVNEGKLNEIIRKRQIAVLREWLNAGFDLGNHTYSHSSPNKVGAGLPVSR